MPVIQYLVSAGMLLLVATGASAAVYKTIDAQGNTVYTDEPGPGARPVDLPPLSTIPPPAVPKRAPEPADRQKAAADAYREIRIVSPEPEATLRDNTGAVPVSASVTPPLKPSHRFQFYLDGQTSGKPTRSSHIVIANVDRGAHNVAVAVLDGKGRELTRSDPVTFYLHRQSINFPRGPGGGPSILPVPQAR